MQQVAVHRHKVSTWIPKAQEGPHIPTIQFSVMAMGPSCNWYVVQVQ